MYDISRLRVNTVFPPTLIIKSLYKFIFFPLQL